MTPPLAQALQQEILSWYDRSGTRYPTLEEIVVAERQQRQKAVEQVERTQQQLDLERQKWEKLATRLRELGIDPEGV